MASRNAGRKILPPFMDDQRSILTAPEAHIDQPDVRQRVLRALLNGDGRTTSIMGLAALIIEKCTGVFYPETTETDPLLDFIHFFETSIGAIVRFR
jgi:hypothetical protein